MNRLRMLSREQMKVLQPLLPRVDDRQVISGTMYEFRNDL